MRRSNGGIIGPDIVTTGGFSGTASGVFKLNEVTDLIRQNKWPEPSPFIDTVPNSVRLDGSADYFNRTMDGTEVTNSEKKVTYSGWIKKSEIGSDGMLIEGWYNGSNYTQFYYQSTGALTINQAATAGGSTYQINTNRLLRDPNAWYHIMLVIDTTQGTASNRVKLYINGVQETSFSSASYPDQNTSHQLNRNGNVTFIGRRNSGDVGLYVNGYMANIECTDAQALTPSYFGSTNSDSGIWTPVPADTISSYGNNGFKLAFANAGALGTDTSGEGNNFTANSITSISQTVDSPSNNWNTWNFLDRYYTQAVFSDGNCTVQTPNASETYCTSTFKMSSGKWYAEISTYDGSNRDNIGIVDSVATANNGNNNLYYKPHGYSYRGWTTSPGVWNNNSQLSGTFASYGSPNTIGVAVDLDNNLIYFSKDGVWQNSADPSSGTGGVSITAAASLTEGSYFFAVGDEVTSDDTTYRANFGNPAYALTSAVADGNGLGQFEYTPPTGFVSLCTNNLNL